MRAGDVDLSLVEVEPADPGREGAMPVGEARRAARRLFARAIETREELERQMPGITAEDGPSFTVLRVEPESDFLRTPPMPYEGPEMKYRFGRALERRFGIEVFGPQGY